MRSLLGAFAVAAVMAAGYGGSGTQRGWLAPGAATSGPLIYVADQTRSAVDVFPESGGAMVGEITDGVDDPYGLYVDKKKTLYVANYGNNTVTAYPAGSTRPSATWSQSLAGPLYPLGIEEFPRGSTQGHTLGMTLNSPQGLVVDGNGNFLAEVLYQTKTQGTLTQMAMKADGNALYSASWTTGNVLRFDYPFSPRTHVVLDNLDVVQGVALSDGQAF